MTSAQARIKRWRENPVSFVLENFGVEPDPWQVEALQAFADPKKERISLQACVGPGKTAVLAWCAWNFLSCYADAGEHPKGAAVSITSDNLSDNLWPELAKWQNRSEFLKNAFTWTKTRIFANDHEKTWFISARSWPKNATPEEQGKTLSGLHSKYVLALVDESGAIPEAVLQAAEQALSNCIFGKIIQAGNPVSLEGMLYAASTRLAGLWHVIRITGDPDDASAWVNSPSVLKRVGTAPRDHARRQIDTYGRDNPWIISQFLGRFPPSSINSLLAPEEVLAAMNRSLPPDSYEWAQPRLGIDVARFGDDRTVFFTRQGRRAYLPVIMRHARDSAQSNDIATKALEQRQLHNCRTICMDATGGWAAGARDILYAMDPYNPPISIQFHLPSPDLRYENLRASLWFQMSEWVKAGAWLPNMPELIGELSTPTYTFNRGKFLIQPKEQVKEKLGRSPDLADALALTFGAPDVAISSGRRQTYVSTTKWG